MFLIRIMIHLSRIDAKESQRVQPDSKIVAIGATRTVTDPHLHWDLYVIDKVVTPIAWDLDGIDQHL